MSGTEELDLDRLGDGGEIADEVFHKLCKLDLHARNQIGDLCAHFCHHLRRCLFVRVLQSHEIIAVIALREIAAKTAAESAREGHHVGIALQDLVDLTDLALRFGERRSGLGEIVEDEASLVDGGHEPRRYFLVRVKSYREQGNERDREDDGAANEDN